MVDEKTPKKVMLNKRMQILGGRNFVSRPNGNVIYSKSVQFNFIIIIKKIREILLERDPRVYRGITYSK